ncbi:hypothetical protein HNQ60_002829 [Povalibacter uvarum]|uniref:Uncharacterized protein n=1 Tax=Povalibacter uvarum TaxID=732238 RepID=A0A841HP91_9GAMM|nr:hypothetical protein [Povalibacter uvarum]
MPRTMLLLTAINDHIAANGHDALEDQSDENQQI